MLGLHVAWPRRKDEVVYGKVQASSKLGATPPCLDTVYSAVCSSEIYNKTPTRRVYTVCFLRHEKKPERRSVLNKIKESSLQQYRAKVSALAMSIIYEHFGTLERESVDERRPYPIVRVCRVRARGSPEFITSRLRFTHVTNTQINTDSAFRSDS